MRPIDADKILYSWTITPDGKEHDGVTLQSIIRQMPTIDPVRKGHKINQHSYPAKWLCSECGAKHFDFGDKFCSKCGANVEEGD